MSERGERSKGLSSPGVEGEREKCSLLEGGRGRAKWFLVTPEVELEGRRERGTGGGGGAGL